MPNPDVPIDLQRPYALREARRHLDDCSTQIRRCQALLFDAQVGIPYLDWCSTDLTKAMTALVEVATHYKIDLREQG